MVYGNAGNGNNGNNGNGNGNQDKPTGSDVKKTSTVVKRFVVDFSSETFRPLMEHEVNGLDYRYVYSDKARLSVVVQGIENGSASLLDSRGELHAYYHCDYLGTTDYLTSAVNSKVISWTSYSEWGEITHNAVLKCGQRELDLVKEYATHDFDAVLNMYYAKARFYDADNRRFVAVDPILDPSQYDLREYVTDPMQLVQYVYVANNAIVRIDPTGETYRIVVRNSTNQILHNFTLQDGRYAKQGYININEFESRLRFNDTRYSFAVNKQANYVSATVERQYTNKRDQWFIAYSMGANLAQATENKADFNSTFSLSSYLQRNNGISPTVYFKVHKCLLGGNQYYVNANQLLSLGGMSAQILKENNIGVDILIDRLFNVAQQTKDYFKASAAQVLLGNYAEEVTWLGTAGQVLTGLVPGLGEVGDFRDVLYDLQNWEWTIQNAANLTIDAAGLIPIVGYIKNADEVTVLLKRGDQILTLGETSSDVVKTMNRIMPDLSDFKYATRFGIDSYDALRTARKGLADTQTHHIIEKRLARVLGISDTDSMLSIVLTKTEHQVFTNKWRELIPYGTDYSSLSKQQVWNAAQQIYAQYPTLLEAAKKTIFGN